MATQSNDSSELWDDESESDLPSGDRVIRMHCPNCSTMVDSHRTVDVTMEPRLGPHGAAE